MNSSDETQSEPLIPLPEAPPQASFEPSVSEVHASVVSAESNVPAFADGQFHSLDDRNVAVERISLLIFWGFIAIAILVGLGFLLLTSDQIDIWFWIACGAGLAVVVASGLFTLLWPKIEHTKISFRIDSLGIEIHQGVLWRSQTCVPIGRVQHADVGQGPLQRYFGVSTLTLHTAGTSNASVSIEGLDHAFAVSVRDWIVHQRKDYDAV